MLIFDSGIGGLFVLKTIKKMLPNIHYVYVLDNEAFPYGTKTELFIIQRSIQIISTIKKKYPITMAVVACNTVSTVALSILKEKFNFPIIGIFPEINLAEKKTKNNMIGLIATKVTVNSIYIQKLISTISSHVTIQILGTNKLAGMSEQKIRGIVPSQKNLKKIFQPWINLTVQPDTIVLGCTHFSCLKKEIKTILHTSSLIYFIDARRRIMKKVQHYFNQSTTGQNIKENIFLYSKNNTELKILYFFLEKYKFQKIQYVNLN